jgi:hypothetical protein
MDGSGKYALQPNRENAHRKGEDDPKTSAEEQTLPPATAWAQGSPSLREKQYSGSRAKQHTCD